jgi:hypothetical protein
MYCNRFHQVVRQQLCKHHPTWNNKWGCVFYVVRAKQRWNNGVLQPVSKLRLGEHTSAKAVTSATTETVLPWGLCRVLLREVTAVTELVQGQLRVSRKLEKRSRRYKAVESTRTRMEIVLSEFWRLVEYGLGQRVAKWLKARRLHSDFK